MKIRLSLIIFITMVIGCGISRHQPKIIPNNTKMKSNYLNLLSQQIPNQVFDFTNDQGQNIGLMNDTRNMEYYELTQKIGNPYNFLKTYYKSSLHIKGESQFFYDCEYGTYKLYDEEGNLTSQEDNDIGFKFTLNKFISKMRDEFQIDLMIPVEGESVRRFKDNDTNKYLYEVFYPIGLNKLNYKWFQIDGRNGDIIKNQIVQQTE